MFLYICDMEREFVNYNIALRLKALGFDEPCFGFYCEGIFYRLYPYHFEHQPKEVYREVNAPTFSQAFRWFREKYRMFHEVFIDTEPSVDEPDKLEFTYLILHMVGSQEMFTSKNKRFDTYEEAELACLEKLIEIVESKSE